MFLASVDFSGSDFTHAHFQKIAPIFSLCNFHNISEIIPSLRRFFVTNDCGFGSCGFLSDLKKCMSQGQGVHGNALGLYADFSQGVRANLVCFLFCAIQTVM